MDNQKANLYGTSTLPDQDKEYIDQYVDTNANNHYDFQMFNEELW